MRARNDNTPLRSSMICCGLLPEFSCCRREVALSLMASPERLSGRTVTAAGSSAKFTPSTIMSPVSEAGPSTEIRLGVFCLFLCAQGSTSHPPRVLCERGPPKRERIDLKVQTVYPRLTRGSFTDKEKVCQTPS
jgi:hypothetical protein